MSWNGKERTWIWRKGDPTRAKACFEHFQSIELTCLSVTFFTPVFHYCRRQQRHQRGFVISSTNLSRFHLVSLYESFSSVSTSLSPASLSLYLPVFTHLDLGSDFHFSICPFRIYLISDFGSGRSFKEEGGCYKKKLHLSLTHMFLLDASIYPSIYQSIYLRRARTKMPSPFVPSSPLSIHHSRNKKKWKKVICSLLRLYWPWARMGGVLEWELRSLGALRV